VSDESLLAGNCSGRCSARLACCHRGDVRSCRAGGRDRVARRGDLARERVAVWIALRDLHPRPRARPPLRRRGEDGLGEHQRLVELLGGALAVRRAVGHGERHRPRWRHCTDGVVHRAPDGRRRVTYDYVIVGGGSAGCALAARLTEDASTRVLVLEAGRTDSWWDLYIHMPAALSFPIGSRFYDWKYESEPEPQLNGRRIYHARGKVLGGSSSINGMIFQRGNPLDFERWAADPGMDSWSYAHCLPYFRRMEDCLAAEPDDPFRGHGGPLGLERGPATNPLFGAFFEATAQAGHPPTDDVNGYRQEGFA